MNNFETLNEDLKTLLSRLVNHVGDKNAITAREIGINGAYLRDLVHTLREKGFPVCSGSTGYWLAETDAELSHTVNHLKSRAREIEKVANALSEVVVDPTLYGELKQATEEYKQVGQRKLF